MTDRNAASRSTPLRDALAHILALSKKALPGPWSHKVLRDYNLSPNDNDTPYVYGPDDTKVMCGLWPVHGPKPENVIEAERQTFATIELVAALRNLIQERGDELLSIAQSETAALLDARRALVEQAREIAELRASLKSVKVERGELALKLAGAECFIEEQRKKGNIK
jgi:hypothetical protein